MANSDKNILITPNKSLSGIPEIALTGLANTTTFIRCSDSSTAELNFVGVSNTIFTISKETSTGQNSLAVVDALGKGIFEITNNGKSTISSKSGKLFIGGEGLQLPKVTNNSFPTAKSGSLVYDSVDKEVKVSNGTTWVSMYSPNHTLTEAVGISPILHYQSSDLSTIADGTVLNSSNRWINNGSLGRNYDMVNDTTSHYSTNITVTTQYNRKAANFSNFCSLAFINAPYILLVPANLRSTWTVAYVYGGGSNLYSSNDSSPSFSGHGAGPITGIPDRIGGGLYGWHNIDNFGGQMSNWWDNDGWSYAGNPRKNSDYPIENVTPNQWINCLNAGRQSSYYGRTSFPITNNQAMTGGSLSAGDGSYSAANIIISGIGHVRRADTSSYTCSGYLYDAVLFDVPLSDDKIQKLRDYYAIKYPFGNITI